MTAKPPNTSALTPDTLGEETATVTFDEIRDSSGTLVSENSVTFDPILELKGTAGANRALNIRDRFTVISDVTTGSSGNWIKKLDFQQGFKRYSLNAMEKEIPYDFSTQYIFVLATETPIIDTVTGKDGPIESGATYDGDSLEFSGYAPPDMEVEAFNGDIPTGKKATVDGDGLFKLTFDGLTAGTYNIKIRATNGKESGVFDFRVVLDVKLILDKVFDSKGQVIAEGGTTYDTKVTVHGYARPGEDVQLRNNDAPIDGATATAREDNGLWEIELEVSPSSYSLDAQALYGEGEISKPPYPFIVALDVKLSLDDVVDSNGSIPEGGKTHDNKVTVSGYARPGRRVQLRNNDGHVGESVAAREEDGFWEIVLDVNSGSYRLTALALYGDGDISAPPRTFTVAVDVELSLDDVLESEDGPSVPEDGTTDKNQLIIKGHARPGESIQLLNGGAPIKDAIATADPGDGVWKILLDVTDGAYSLAAKANYDNGDISAPPRTFTVSSIIKPHNTRVYDSDGPIEDNGNTPYNHVIVRGDAKPSAGIKLKINGDTDPTPEPTDDKGKWARLVRNLKYETRYEFIAVADYGANAESNSWTITTGAAAIVPILDDVTDPVDNSLGGNGQTIHTRLTFMGQAKPLETVEILNGASRLGEATVDEKGNFRKVILGLPATTYDIIIRGLYSDNPESSPPWKFTIVPVVKPTIERIFDSTSEIPPDGYTNETSVTVAGQAHTPYKVGIMDGSDFLEEVQAYSGNLFSHTISGLSLKTYNLRVIPLYGSDLPSSAIRRFTVKRKLTIESVTNGAGSPVSDGGSTPGNTILTIDGYGAVPDTQVTLLLNNNALMDRNASSEGAWRFVISAPIPGGPYTLGVRDGNGETSQTWTFSVTSS